MKKSIKLIVYMSIMTIFLFGLISCISFSAILYSNANEYSVGDTTVDNQIETLDIDWISGNIKIETHEEKEIIIKEECNGEISNKMRVHWWADGKTLRIKFAASGIKLKLFKICQKELTIVVPKTNVFSKIDIKASSASIETTKISSNKVSISSSSGRVNAILKTNKMKINTSSGDVTLHQEGETDKINISTSSGSINLFGSKIDSVTLKSSSGKIKGDFEVTPSKGKFYSTSGNVILNLPESGSFIIKSRSTSGDFESNFALVKSGKTYTYGDGSSDIDIRTASGDVTVNKK